MIYLDNGATTFPKPTNVVNAVINSLRHYGANPGRSGHKLAVKASEIIYDCRKEIADLFNIGNPENVIFTVNCTTAINTVIKGLLKPGDHVVISSYEHNAVLRPLEKLKRKGISYSIVDCVDGDNDATLDNFRNSIRENTKLLVCNYASNVFGVKLPVERICALCHQYDILCCVDGAQTAGIIPIDLSNSSIDYLCIAGHKGLYGPMGTGAIIINTEKIPDSLVEGGTGSSSAQYNQPEILPDKFESGTVNFIGIAGLSAGVKFVKNRGIINIYKHEMELIKYLYDRLNNIDKVDLYTQRPDFDCFVPVLSFNIKDKNSEDVSVMLSDKFNIATRAGLHCAPLAHKSKGTLDIGTVRVVPSLFTTKNDIDMLIRAIHQL